MVLNFFFSFSFSFFFFFSFSTGVLLLFRLGWLLGRRELLRRQNRFLDLLSFGGGIRLRRQRRLCRHHRFLSQSRIGSLGWYGGRKLAQQLGQFLVVQTTLQPARRRCISAP